MKITHLFGNWSRCACILALIALTGCVSVNAPFSGVSNRNSSIGDHGYALLYDLMGDEKDVSKLLIIKRERTELGNLIKEIAERSSRAHKQLEAFAKANPGLNLKDLGLPSAEVATREGISKAKGKQLLGAKGKELELELLLAQDEALVYGSHLAGAIAISEPNSERGQFLRELASDLGGLRQKLVDQIAANYAWSSPR